MEKDSVSTETHQAIAREAAEEIADKCALHMTYIKPREIGKATAIILAAIDRARDEWLESDFVANNDPSSQPQRSETIAEEAARIRRTKVGCKGGALSEGAHLEEPPATDEGVKAEEWTPEYVRDLQQSRGFITSETGWQAVADAHNAALAAEREKLEKTEQAGHAWKNLAETYLSDLKETRQQLLQAQAAIAEHNSKPLVDALNRLAMRVLQSDFYLEAKEETHDALAKVKEGKSIPNVRTVPVVP